MQNLEQLSSITLTTMSLFNDTHNCVRLSRSVHRPPLQQAKTVQTPAATGFVMRKYLQRLEKHKIYEHPLYYLLRKTGARLGVVHANLQFSFLPFFSSAFISVHISWLSAIEPLFNDTLASSLEVSTQCNPPVFVQFSVSPVVNKVNFSFIRYQISRIFIFELIFKMPRTVVCIDSY